VFRRNLAASGSADDTLLLEELDPTHFVSLTRTKDWRYVLINSHAKLSSEVQRRAAAWWLHRGCIGSVCSLEMPNAS